MLSTTTLVYNSGQLDALLSLKLGFCFSAAGKGRLPSDDLKHSEFSNKASQMLGCKAAATATDEKDNISSNGLNVQTLATLICVCVCVTWSAEADVMDFLFDQQGTAGQHYPTHLHTQIWCINPCEVKIWLYWDPLLV